jgi:GT2 family glycosyltransferase
MLRRAIDLFKSRAVAQHVQQFSQDGASLCSRSFTVSTREAGIRGWYRFKVISSAGLLARVRIEALDQRNATILAFERSSSGRRFAGYVYVGPQVVLIRVRLDFVTPPEAGTVAGLRPIPLVEYIWRSLRSGFIRDPLTFLKNFFRSTEPLVLLFDFPRPLRITENNFSAVVDGRTHEIRNIAHHFQKVVAMASAEACSATESDREVPRISFVVPAFDTPPTYLDQLLASFAIQEKGAWELILVDDGSTSTEMRAWLDRDHGIPELKIVRKEKNEGIAAAINLGIFAACGEWVGVVDHDDALAPFAIARLLATIKQNPDARFIYTDEVVADRNLTPQGYFLKPAYDPVLLSGVNYINHLSLFRRDRLIEIGGLRNGFEGSQDYDLLLRYLAAMDSSLVRHLPYPAYLWRSSGDSYSATFFERSTQNARRALAEAYGGIGAPAPVLPALDPNLHRVSFDASVRAWPKLSVVIPNRDSFELLSQLLEGLERKTDYPDFEVIVPDNGSKDPRVLAMYERMRGSGLAFRAEMIEAPFNFSRQVNRGMRMASGSHFLLLNNDIEVLDPGWMKEMVTCLAYPNAGIVGARLLYPDGRLQHAGVIVGLGGAAGHWFGNESASQPGPLGRLKVRQTFSAVTGACMLISRACRSATGDFDEDNFGIAFSDIDYCLRAGECGFRTVWTPFATLVHHESASRGSDEAPANRDRFKREKANFRVRHRSVSFDDRAFNPWYARDRFVPTVRLPDRLPSSR